MTTTSLLIFIILLLISRTILMWVIEGWSESAFAERTRIYAEPISQEQAKRENKSWPFIFLSQSAGIWVFTWLGFIHFTPFDLWSIPVILAVHVFVVEPLYFVYHLLLHTPYLYKNIISIIIYRLLRIRVRR